MLTLRSAQQVTGREVDEKWGRTGQARVHEEELGPVSFVAASSLDEVAPFVTELTVAPESGLQEKVGQLQAWVLPCAHKVGRPTW